jgi:hypothetical protein
MNEVMKVTPLNDKNENVDIDLDVDVVWTKDLRVQVFNQTHFSHSFFFFRFHYNNSHFCHLERGYNFFV